MTRPRPYPDFDRMRELWDDLERWVNEEKSGELGILNINVTGRWVHVGRPIAQTLLTEKERKALPVIFAAADLDPTSPPSDQAIALLLVRYGRQQLRPRTVRLLERTSDSDKPLRDALLERIVDELRDWDGTSESMPSDPNAQIYASLRLCCQQLDRIAGRVKVTLRCRAKQEFPEDGLLLVSNGYSDSFYCEEEFMGWSSPIQRTNFTSNVCTKGQLDASHFNWLEGLRLQDSEQKWCFRLPPSPIRIFVTGADQGLSGLVEVRQLPSASPFYLAAHHECYQLLERWGETSCKGFERLPITVGLPQGWHLYYAVTAYSDEIVKREYPILSLPNAVRLDLVGGVRIGKGNQFFKFAPPKLILQGNDSIKVYCNGTPLHCSQTEGIYELPYYTLDEARIEIEARKGEDVIRRRSLFLIEDFPWSDRNLGKQFDRFGHRLSELDDDTSTFRGALVVGAESPPFNFNTLLPVQGKQRVFFVGKEPGQVTTWPEESLPADWSPVWAISIGRRGQAVFCGTGLAESEPTQSTCGDRKKLRRWKDILWYRRKRISPPTSRSLLTLWTRFQQEAKRVK